MLQLALKDDLTVEVRYYKDYDFKTIKNKVVVIDSINRNLRFRNGYNIYLDDIIDVDRYYASIKGRKRDD